MANSALSTHELRVNVRLSLDRVFDQGLFGCNDPAPLGTMRGIDVMPLGEVRQKITRAGIIFQSAYEKPPCFHEPKTFYEKLTLSKFFAPIPMPSPADKLGVSQFIPSAVKSIVQPVPVMWQSSQALTEQSIAQAALKDGRYFLKSNNGCGSVSEIELPVTERRIKRLNRISQKWLKTEHGTKAGEWWYNLIGPKIFIEQGLGVKDKSIDDWKFHTGGGKILAVQLDQDRSQDHRQLLFDADFNFINEELFFKSGTPIEKPDFFDDMRTAALAIAQQFEFARLDFYHADGKVYLGEVTLAPMGGQRPPRSATLNELMGQSWGSGLFSEA